MTRDIKTIKLGEGAERETITLRSNIATERGSTEAYCDLFNTLRTALDSNLLRYAKNCPDKVTIVHNGLDWVIIAVTETDP